MRRVDVVPYDPEWLHAFEASSEPIVEALGNTIVAVHHIGSTSIPGIHAKPIIDLLIEVKDVAEVDRHNLSMQSLGYEAMGEFGIPGRRYFRKNNGEGVRTHHVHMFKADSEQVVRHLAFRDYMISHPKEAERYSNLKRRLAKQYPTSIDSYTDGKDAFIKQIDEKAARWRAAQTQTS